MPDYETEDYELTAEEEGRAAEKKPAEPENTDSVHLFIEALRELLPRDQHKEILRITPHGVFVHAPGFERLVQTYQAWLMKKTGGQVVKSRMKCIKRLFEAVNPPQYYLVEGKQCLIGFLIPCEIQQPQRYNLPFYLGSLLDTRQYLHPRDPLLAELQPAEVTTTPQGVEARFPVRGRKMRVTADALKAFGALAANSQKIQQKFPEAGRSVREALRALMQLAGKTQPVDAHEPLLIPGRLRQKDLKYLRLGTLVLVTAGEELMIGCYELRGKNFMRLLHEESAALQGPKRGPASGAFRGPRRIGPLELPRGRSKYLGSIQVGRETFLLHPRAFKEFIEGAPDAPSLRESLGCRFTVFDCIKKLPYVFSAAQRAETRQIASYLPKSPPRGARFRAKDEWIFMIMGRNVLMSCLNKRSSRRK